MLLNNQLHFFILGSSLVCANCNKASLICGAWNFIVFTLSMRLFQHVCGNDLRVKLVTLSYKIFHLFVEEENSVYMCCITPKNDIAFGQELALSHSTRLVL